MNDYWHDVPGWPGFAVTEFGEIRGPSGRVLHPMRTDSGHLYVTHGKRSRKLYIHTAVLLTFVGACMPGLEARHLNGNPTDNRPSNLAWGTRYEQRADDRRNGVHRRSVKIALDDVPMIRSSSESSRALADRLGVSHTTIQKIRRGERFDYVG